jgi:hypothetical protein
MSAARFCSLSKIPISTPTIREGQLWRFQQFPVCDDAQEMPGTQRIAVPRASAMRDSITACTISGAQTLAINISDPSAAAHDSSMVP